MRAGQTLSLLGLVPATLALVHLTLHGLGTVSARVAAWRLPGQDVSLAFLLLGAAAWASVTYQSPIGPLLP